MADAFSLPKIWKLRGRIALFLVCLLALTPFAFGVGAVVPASDFSGEIRFIDGDTLDVGQTRVRLHAVDAPETGQMCETRQGTDWACGGWISKAVADRYDGAVAECDVMDTDRYGRTVARCRALGDDIGAWLVNEGLAFAYVQYGSDYIAAERIAAAADRGLHAVQVQTPSQYRKSRIKGRTPTDANCAIKGNINASGTRIYHMPGQTFYERTGINTRKGERWFCSAAAAQAAGWRASRR